MDLLWVFGDSSKPEQNHPSPPGDSPPHLDPPLTNWKTNKKTSRHLRDAGKMHPKTNVENSHLPPKQKKNNALRLWKNCLFVSNMKQKTLKNHPKPKKSPSNRLSTSAFRSFGTWLCCGGGRLWCLIFLTIATYRLETFLRGQGTLVADVPSSHMHVTLPETNSSHFQKWRFPKAKMVSQAIIFHWRDVSFLEGNNLSNMKRMRNEMFTCFMTSLPQFHQSIHTIQSEHLQIITLGLSKSLSPIYDSTNHVFFSSNSVVSWSQPLGQGAKHQHL